MIKKQDFGFLGFFFFPSAVVVVFTQTVAKNLPTLYRRGDSCAQGQTPACPGYQSLAAKPADAGGWAHSRGKRNGGGLVGCQLGSLYRHKSTLLRSGPTLSYFFPEGTTSHAAKASYKAREPLHSCMSRLPLEVRGTGLTLPQTPINSFGCFYSRA